jgi:hypothetical protein
MVTATFYAHPSLRLYHKLQSEIVVARATAQSKRIRTHQTYTCQVEYPLVDGATIKSSALTRAFLALV